MSLSASAAAISLGGSATLSWSAVDAQAAHIDQGIGSIPLQGSRTISPTATTTYTLTATGTGGTAHATVTVAVTGNPAPQPEGSFGEKYQDLIPPDATVERYDPKRFALVTGLVQDIQGLPLPGVLVGIHGHPDYGTALTDGQGRYSLPVEGGGLLTVIYRKGGFISAQRQVQVPWNDTAVVETVSLTAEDSAATIVKFNGSSATVVTHRSTEVSDSRSTRAATVVFMGDNKAYLTDEAGNKTLELGAITTRATEYQSPGSMPAVLPQTSAFTWCAELQVDGAERVKFEKPVTVWVENFLGFPVGAIVPVGYYDRDKATWVPSENGRVVQLLDTDGDGVVDALDANGDGAPDDLNANGSTQDEVLGLEDRERYAAGATFWRAAVTHFTPVDFNWPLVLPSDSIDPNPPAAAFADQQLVAQKDCRVPTCSFVEEKSRIFHEDIPIPGTEFTLHYSSGRVRGYKPGVLSISASGASVPASLQEIIVQATVARRRFEKRLPPEPEQTAQIEWDGLDHLGRVVDHSVKAYIRIGFVYQGLYAIPASLGPAFGQAGTGPLSGLIASRQPIIRWQEQEQTLVRGMDGGKASLAEGWTLSVHHFLSMPDTLVLHKGDGSISRNNMAVIETVAGDGSSNRSFSGMGGPGVKAQIGTPLGLATDAAGNLYILSGYVAHPVEGPRWQILKLNNEGIIDYYFPSPVEGLRRLNLDKNGDFYSSWDARHVVYKFGPSYAQGIAGQWGLNGYGGDGGPAVNALLTWPKGVAVDEQGNVFIADGGNGSVRRVDANGIIATVAGIGTLGFSNGDGGPATSATLSTPYDVAVDPQGNLLIAENNTAYNLVRRVDASGVITTVAGNRVRGGDAPVDGALATQSSFPTIDNIEVDPAGNLYILSSDGCRVFKVDTAGIVTTAAGTGQAGFSGDGGPGKAAALYAPSAIALDARGDLFIADTYNNRVRKVSQVPAQLKGRMSVSEVAFSEEGTAHILSSSGRHLRTIELDTGAVLYAFSYDQEGGLASITDRFGNRTVIERGADGSPRAIVSADGIRTELGIDSNNHLTGIGYPDGRSYRFEYTPSGLATLKVQPSGNRFFHIYDENGRLRDSLDEEGGSWRFSKNMLKTGEVLSETLTAEGDRSTHVARDFSTGAYESTFTDASGAQSKVTESADGLTVESILSCGMNVKNLLELDPMYKYKYVKESTAQTPSGLTRVTKVEPLYTDLNADGTVGVITRKTSVNGRTSTLTYDIGVAKKTLTSAGGRTFTAYYDPDTLAAEKLQAPGLLDTLYSYDNRGRLTQAAVGNRATSFGYTDKGFLGSVTDAQSRTTSYVHDALGRVKQVSRPDQSQIRFDYDANGSMTVLVNPSGVPHRFAYNKVNRPSAYTTPMSGSYLYKYDKDRRLTETVLPSGRSIRNLYDKGRLARTEMPEGTTYFNYLCGSKLGSVTKDGEGITYVYDGSLLTSETLSGSLNQGISYVYDNNFELVQATYAGQSTGYGYDQDGLLTQAGPYSIARDAGNGLPYAVSDGKLALNRSFNGYGEVASQALAVSGRPVSSWSLLRDNTGRITRRSEAVGASTAVYDYLYDENGRLLKVLKDNAPVEEYAYDENGARIFEMNTLRGIASRSYEYSDEDHLLKAGEWVYQYNADGFLTSKTNSTNPANKTVYFYSSRGELLTVMLPDGKRIDYVCDPLGRRIAKKINGVTVEKYHWQGMTRLLAVYDGNNSLLMRFEYADDRMPVAIRMGSATYYLSYDQVGSLRAVADSSGSVVKWITYDSFGNVLSDTNPALTVPFGFAGGLLDRDTGLVGFGYRDYDPEVGRWTAKDPIGFLGGDTDLYGYVQSDPVNLSDPLGLFNPTKGLSSLGNAANAGRLYAGGILKLAAAAGLIGTGVGAPVGVATAALGAWNIWSAQSAWNRSVQQWNETWNESWSDASWRNLLGVLPFGTEFDDPCEPSIGEVFQHKAQNFLNKPGEFLKEVGTWGL